MAYMCSSVCGFKFLAALALVSWEFAAGGPRGFSPVLLARSLRYGRRPSLGKMLFKGRTASGSKCFVIKLAYSLAPNGTRNTKPCGRIPSSCHRRCELRFISLVLPHPARLSKLPCALGLNYIKPDIDDSRRHRSLDEPVATRLELI